MDLEPKQVLQKLWDLFDADLIGKGTSDISFQGLNDGTLYLILQSRFEGEISTFSLNLKQSLTEKYDKLVKELKSTKGKWR